MRLRAAHQLFLSYLVLIAGVVVALSLGAESILRRHLLANATADLRRELLLGHALYEEFPQAEPDSIAKMLGSLSSRRVTIVAPDGAVLGDSHVPAAELRRVENHGSRPEIREAMIGGIGSDVRHSTTVDTEQLYLAIRTRRGEVIRFAVPTAEYQGAIARVQRTIFSVGAAALILAAFFSVGFSLAVTRPLRAISGVARAMAGGNLARRVRSARGDELGDLGDALDALADELQRRLGQLEAERVEMQTLIDSMAEAVLALEPDGRLRRANPAAARIFSLPADPRGLPPEAVARRPEFLRLIARVLGGEPILPTEVLHDGRHLLATGHPLPEGGAVLVLLDVSELRRLENVRRDFVANASHELKTPLTAIRGYSETLLDDDLPAELRQQFTETVKANADRLQRIVDDLLDLSRLESGGWQIEPGRVELDALAREAWRESRPAADVDFEVDIDVRCGELTADPAALRQVFANLLSNAARYTPPGGRITVRAFCVPAGVPLRGATRRGASQLDSVSGIDRVLVEVADTGSGIPAAHLPRIFERFYRVDPARSRSEGGTGLGLAIVKHLVEGHAGQVEAISTVGGGTTIRFTLPTEFPRD